MENKYLFDTYYISSSRLPVFISRVNKLVKLKEQWNEEPVYSINNVDIIINMTSASEEQLLRQVEGMKITQKELDTDKYLLNEKDLIELCFKGEIK